MLNRGYITINVYIQNFQFRIDLHTSLETNVANPTRFEGTLLNFKTIIQAFGKESPNLMSFCAGSITQNMNRWSYTTFSSGPLPH